MARIKDLIPPQSLRFADNYDVYVDYGKGRPVKMNDNEATFIDVERFLIGQSNQSKTISNRKSNENQSSIKNIYTHDSTAYSERL